MEHEQHDSTSSFFNEWAQPTSKIQRSILPDLAKYSYSDEIKNKADWIYNRMNNKIYRKKRRSMVLFFCVFNACRELGINADKDEMAGVFGLTPYEATKCINSIFTPGQTNYSPKKTVVLPTSFMESYATMLDFSDETRKDFMKTCVGIIMKDVGILGEHPQAVAAAMLHYYCETRGIIFSDPKKLVEITKRSMPVILRLSERIAMVDNGVEMDGNMRDEGSSLGEGSLEGGSGSGRSDA